MLPSSPMFVMSPHPLGVPNKPAKSRSWSRVALNWPGRIKTAYKTAAGGSVPLSFVSARPVEPQISQKPRDISHFASAAA